MKKSKVKLLTSELMKVCRDKGLNYSKKLLRRAKKIYKRTPWKQRAAFTLLEMPQ